MATPLHIAESQIMKTLINFLLLPVAYFMFMESILYASSTYIDNPNFDVEVSADEAFTNERNCVGWCDVGVASGSYVKYHETVNGDTIEDRSLCLGWPRQCSGDTGTAATSATYYINKKFAYSKGLYALVEVGYDERVFKTEGVSDRLAEINTQRNATDSSVKVLLELIESKGHAQHKVLFRKVVSIKGSDRWHVIASDFPVYKTAIDREDEENGRYRTLALRVTFTDTVRARRCLLNFAQVGDSPLSLGGRGRRDRDMDDL